MTPAVKPLFALVCFSFLSACSTLTGGAQSTNADLDTTETAEMRVAALESEISDLKADNDRLANELNALLKEQKLAEAVALKEAEDSAVDPLAPTLSGAPVIRVPDPTFKPREAVADAGLPELNGEDVPVENAPRMVQPTFASTDTVFENEADGEIETQSILFGVHLASYRKPADATEGWGKLQRENPDELGLLEPRIEEITVPEKGNFLRLIGGGFSSEEKAAALCASLQQKGLYCSVTGFNGDRLPLAQSG
ncbi:MAG: hypothetical protein DHS20C05_18850 [Hyphococcus sp.]|nr:MAG: hypothetical protein DHS20C05_18850 [Marinicaulis sp.]